MSRQIFVRLRAEGDLQRAWDWYEHEQPGLGDKFLAETRELIRSLDQHPARTVDYYRGFHRLLAPRFPYKVFYRLKGDRVIVFRVLHSKQHHPRHLRQ